MITETPCISLHTFFTTVSLGYIRLPGTVHAEKPLAFGLGNKIACCTAEQGRAQSHDLPLRAIGLNRLRKNAICFRILLKQRLATRDW